MSARKAKTKSLAHLELARPTLASNVTFFIDRIEDINGNIIYDPQKKYSTKYETYTQLSFPWINNEKFDYLDKPLIAVDLEDPIQAMDPRVAFMLSDILKEV